MPAEVVSGWHFIYFLLMLTYNQTLYSLQTKDQRKYLHDLIQKSLAYKVGINISSAIAQSELGRGYKQILNELFYCVDGYSVGNKCRTWRIKADKVYNTSTKDERTAKKTASYITFDKSVDDILKGYSHHERLCATSHINKCYAAKCREDLIYNIDNTLGGRETNAFACLPSEIRARATGVLASMDIKSSQPRTTIKVLKIDEYKNKDAVYFTYLVNTGKIYEHLSTQLHMTRTQAKIAYNASINSDCSTNSFGAMHNKAAVSKYIKIRFPTVYNIVKEYAAINGKKSIGRACMTLEANAINAIVKKHNVVPVYDQIYIFGGDVEQIKKELTHSINQHMGWTDIAYADMVEIKNHNEFLQQEHTEEEKTQGTIILVSKPKSLKMLRYVQRRLVQKWFDFTHFPVRI